jgi:hypothetical protein
MGGVCSTNSDTSKNSVSPTKPGDQVKNSSKKNRLKNISNEKSSIGTDLNNYCNDV